MASFAYWIILALTNGQMDSKCGSQVTSKVASCFSRQALTTCLKQGDAGDVLAQALNIEKEALCRRLTTYRRAISCTFGAVRECFEREMKGALPNSDQYSSGLGKLCQTSRKFDNECVNRQGVNILACTRETARKVLKLEVNDLPAADALCITYDIIYDCSKLHLESCGQVTLDTMLDHLNSYQIPKACASKPPGRAGRENYLVNSFQIPKACASKPPGRTGRENYLGGSAPAPVALSALAAAVSLVMHLLPLH